MLEDVQFPWHSWMNLGSNLPCRPLGNIFSDILTWEWKCWDRASEEAVHTVGNIRYLGQITKQIQEKRIGQISWNPSPAENQAAAWDLCVSCAIWSPATWEWESGQIPLVTKDLRGSLWTTSSIFNVMWKTQFLATRCSTDFWSRLPGNHCQSVC